MIIESFGILCIITITGCINYNYYRIFKNDYEFIKSEKENIKNIIKKELVDKSTQVEKILDNNLLKFNSESSNNENEIINSISFTLTEENEINNSIINSNILCNIDCSGISMLNDNEDNEDNKDIISIHSSDSFSTFSTINSELSYEKE